MKKPHIIGTAIVALAVVGAGIAALLYFKPHKDYESATPDYVVSVRTIVSDFEHDEAAANRKYVAGDKTILVKGTIASIDTDSNGIMTITLGESGVDGTVHCALMPDQHEVASRLKAGDRIGIKGQCTGVQTLIDTEVIMIRCGVDAPSR